MNTSGKIFQRILRFGFFVLLVAVFGVSADAQTWPPATSVPNAPQPQVTLRETPLNILKDQGAIWSSPVRIRDKNLRYLIPLGLAVTVAITTDHQAMSEVVSTNPSFNNANTTASNVLVSPFIAAPAVMFAAGQLKGNDHARETGILGGEAILNSLVVEQGMKLIFWRERPTVERRQGQVLSDQRWMGFVVSFVAQHDRVVERGCAGGGVSVAFESAWDLHPGHRREPDARARPAALPIGRARRQRLRVDDRPLRLQEAPPLARTRFALDNSSSYR